MVLPVSPMSFFILLATVSVSSSNNSSLRFVHVVWRHGARAPLYETFPTDLENSLKSWTEGPGGLTSVGFGQQYDLGTFLRQRYIETGFMSPGYSPNEIRVRTSHSDRTRKSAKANMIGFYSLSDRDEVEDTIKSLPIPIDSSDDHVINVEAHCPVANRARAASLLKSAEVNRTEAENRGFLRQLSDLTGSNLRSILRDIGRIRDPLECEKAQQRKWPSSITPEIFKNISDLHDWTWTIRYADPTVLRLRGGLLFREIALRSEQKARGTIQPSELKYYAISGHDHTMATLLTHIGAFDGHVPPFASAILFELHQKSRNRYVMKTLYINKSGEDIKPHALNMKKCGGLECELGAFVNLAERNSPEPENWLAECGLSDKRGS